MIKINAIPIPKYPSSLSVLVSDLDDGNSTGRTIDGLLHRDRIAVKRKLEMSFNMLTGSELSTLLKQISGTFFDVEYPDPQTGLMEIKNFYVGDRTSPIALLRDGVYYWSNVSFNFIER